MDIKEKGEKFLNKRERQYFTFPIKTEKESIRTTLRTTGYLGRRKKSDSLGGAYHKFEDPSLSLVVMVQLPIFVGKNA